MDFIKKRPITYLLFSLLLCSIFLYHDTITLFPAFIHSWSQADRYAIALGFLENGFDLFHPQTYDLETVDGITRVDFPINEYIIALIMKLLGTTAPVVFRVYTLCISFIGLIYLYLLTKKITFSESKSWLVVFFAFLSPLLVYYQAGFIPSVSALAFTFIAYYYFFSFKENGYKKELILSICFFVLAALVRMPFVIFLFAALLQQVFLMLKTKRAGVFELIVFTSGFIVFGICFRYNVHLQRMYGSIFLSQLMPPKSFSEFKEILTEMYSHWGLHYFTKAHYILLLSSLILLMGSFIKKKIFNEEYKKYWFHLLIVFCGTFMYFITMARQYYSHDYYFLDSFFVPFILLFILSLRAIKIETKNQRLIFNVVALISVCFFIFDNINIQKERYSSGPWDRTEITRQNFIGSGEYLDSIGIPKDAKILVIDAYTYNVPFILMQRKGWPVLATNYKNISTSLFWSDWDYVVIQDVYLVSDVIKNYPLITSMIERVGGNGKISLYKRSKTLSPKTLTEFLGIDDKSVKFRMKETFGLTSSLTDKNKYCGKLDSLTEFGLTVKVLAKDLDLSSHLKVLVSFDFSGENIEDLHLVSSISNANENIYYQTFLLSDYFKSGINWQRAEFQFVLPHFKTREDELGVYLWNPAKKIVRYTNWELIVYK